MPSSLPRPLVSRFTCAVVLLLVPSLGLRGQDVPPAGPASRAPVPLESSSHGESRRDISASLLPANFLRDQKKMWLFPRQLANRRHWTPTVALAAATVALLSADPHVDPYFLRTTAFRGFNRAFGSKITGAETITIPAALYAIGFSRHDSYMQETALFAGEAMADSEVLRMVMNSVTARWRPADVVPQRNYAATFFRNRVHIGSSFPSGHTIAAVSVATVIARRYRKHRWVPWAAYGLAGTIGFSRISLRAHFPSDVFLGTVLGYAIARYDVLQDH